MHTSTKTQETVSLEELFSQENLDKYQMTETHQQDINEMDTKDTKQKKIPFGREIFLKLEINLSHRKVCDHHLIV